jgi:hypothetical protein
MATGAKETGSSPALLVIILMEAPYIHIIIVVSERHNIICMYGTLCHTLLGAASCCKEADSDGR